MIIVADSGSTKTAWGLLADSSSSEIFETPGINPVRDDAATIRQVIQQVAAKVTAADISAVYFYGAGCVAPYSEAVVAQLQLAFPQAAIHVESDLLGAARALCGRQVGVACILGTGSNSCYYDGEKIAANVSPLGWILGDEGSGAVLGRQLVGDVLKGQLPAALCEAFLERYQLTRGSIIEAVYRSPQPNRFLASLVPFLSEHSADPAIHAFVVREFRRFFVRNVAAYGCRELPVHFVGSIAAHFTSELMEAAANEGFRVGEIEKSPIGKLMAFHQRF